MNGPIKNISRHCTINGAGWYVRIRRNGKVKRKYFADKRYGGRTQSLQAAVTYRNRLAKQRDGRLRIIR